MKITVCGKSTVSALLAKEFERMGKTVLVADSDESNYGLHRQLGVKLPRDFTEYFGGKEKAFKTMMVGEILDTVKLSAFAKKFYSEPFTLNEIPEEYIARNNGVMLISSGKIHQANEGCACTMNSILKQFIKHLTVEENEVVLLDMEAGVEHFDNSVDLILMIVDPSFESLKLTKKIQQLGESIGKTVFFVLNKVNGQILPTMLESIDDQSKVLAVISEDTEIARKGLLGNELMMEIPEIHTLARKILKQ
ncbi:CO dehydrogenase maturation factor [uncultured Blautia sp.]|nr:ATP-binding protein [uncultured Blautia sp.]SCH77301.1 CO dehydrogenase maturation factor [uncultured Blautia sp.]